MANKLRPIYEALDSGNNKQALKLCNHTLKKKETPSLKVCHLSLSTSPFTTTNKTNKKD
jgi:hypothetical protein